MILRRTPAHEEGSLTWLIACLVLCALAVAGIVAVIGVKRAAKAAIGQPTSPEARVETDKIEADTHRRMEEVRNAPMERKLDRARTLRERGRLPRDD